MYGIAITYGLVSLLILGGFAYLTLKITKKWGRKKQLEKSEENEIGVNKKLIIKIYKGNLLRNKLLKLLDN